MCPIIFIGLWDGPYRKIKSKRREKEWKKRKRRREKWKKENGREGREEKIFSCENNIDSKPVNKFPSTLTFCRKSVASRGGSDPVNRLWLKTKFDRKALCEKVLGIVPAWEKKRGLGGGKKTKINLIFPFWWLKE